MIRKTWYSVDKTTLAKVPCIEKISIYNLNIHEHIAAALSQPFTINKTTTAVSNSLFVIINFVKFKHL